MSRVRGSYTQGDVYNATRRDGVITTQSYLRLEKSIQGTVNSINFDVLANQGSAGATERRLQLTDTFTITALAVMIYKAGTSTTATSAQRAAARLRTWPNPLIFTGASEADALETLYNGYLGVKVNSTVYVESLDLRSFYRVHTSQQLAGPVTTIPADEWPQINNGFKKIVPTITLNGAAKNDISLTLPLATNLGGTASENFVVCYLRGFLNQNAAVLNPGA